MCNDEEPILNISQAERGRKERLLTEVAQNYLGERGFKAIPQFTIHRSFEYRIHPGNELREAIEKDVFFNENLVSGGVWNTEISYRNGYEHRLDVLGIGYGMASFVYTEKSPSGAVSEGHVSVPAEFLIGIPVFEDGPAYTIRAKLRYRIDRSSGELRLWYELQQLQRVFAKAMEAHVQKLEELLSGELPIYSGR